MFYPRSCHSAFVTYKRCCWCHCRRLLQNPAYYDLEDPSPEGLSEFMSNLVEDALQELADSGCVVVSIFPLAWVRG
jgi:hypothetical protein